MSQQRFRAAFMALALAAGATPTSAQNQNAGTGDPPATEDRQSLTVSATVAQAYDDDVPRFIDPTSFGLGGYSTVLSGSADYSWLMGTVRAGATAASSLRRYYSSVDEFRALNHSAGIGISAPLGRRTSLFANQTASYSPSYLYGLFPQDIVASPGGIQPVAPDYFINDFESMSYGTTVTISQRLTRRNSMSVTGDASRTHFLQESVRNRDLQIYSVAGRFSRSLARRTSFNAGYRYRNGDFGYDASLSARATTEHTIDVGLDYVRPLSATRRFTLGGGFGSSLMTLPAGAPGLVGLAGGQYRGLSGQAAISYQLGRSWAARGTYRRGIEYIAGLTEPVLADSASVSVGGFLTRKLDLSSSVGYSTGASALNQNSLLFDTYTGNVRLRYPVNSMFAVFAEYLYYFYDFRQSAQLAPNVPLGLERNGVRAGLTLRVPILPR